MRYALLSLTIAVMIAAPYSAVVFETLNSAASILAQVAQ